MQEGDLPDQQFQKIQEVETCGKNDANRLLADGWELLGVFPRALARMPAGGNPFHIVKGVSFVIGRPLGVDPRPPKPEPADTGPAPPEAPDPGAGAG